MGEIADMMLDGTMCEGCGSYLDGEGYGIPRYCSNECAKDRGYDGVQSDGAGTFKKKKKVKGEQLQCLSVRVSYNGQSLFGDGKTKFIFHDLPKDKATEIANKLREILEPAPTKPTNTGKEL